MKRSTSVRDGQSIVGLSNSRHELQRLALVPTLRRPAPRRSPGPGRADDRRAQRRRQRRSPANPGLRRRDPSRRRSGLRGWAWTDFNQFLSAQGVVHRGPRHAARAWRCRRTAARSPAMRNRAVRVPRLGPEDADIRGLPRAAGSPTASKRLASSFPQGLNEHLGHGDTLGPCPCVDADGDGFTTCAGDCNDDDPARSLGASDASCNGIDDDCDGIVDDAAGAVGRPALTDRDGARTPACPGTP